jgi:soluble lytic murein transglycosylase
MRRSRGVALAALIVAAFAGFALGRQRASAPPALADLDVQIEAAASEFGLDPHLLRALVAVESGGDPAAVSRAGAVGLAQLMPATAKEQAQRLRIPDYAEARLVEPVLNLRLGASYLARLLRRFEGEEAFALAAYNAGPTRVLRWREKAPDVSARTVIEREGFEETRTHLRRVLRYRDVYAGR